MMRHIRIALSALLLLASGLSHATNYRCPASYIPTDGGSTVTGYGYATTESGACTNAAGQFMGAQAYNSGGAYLGTISSSYFYNGQCSMSTATQQVSVAYCSVVAECTEGQTLDPTSGCQATTCTPPQVLQNGVCVDPPQEDCNQGPGPNTGQQYSGNYSMMRMGGCSYEVASAVCVGTNCGSWAGRRTGASCTQSTSSSGDPMSNPDTSSYDSAAQAAAESCLAANQGYVSINGVVSCTAATTSSPVTTTSQVGQSTTTSSNGTSSTTTYLETTTNYGGSSVTTLSQTTTNSSGETTTTTSQGNTSGEVDTSGTSDDYDYCADAAHADEMQCIEMGSYTDGTDLETRELGVSDITPVSIGDAGSCPASVAMPFGGEFSYQIFCDFASGVRPLFLAMAWLFAGFIVLGAMKQ